MVKRAFRLGELSNSQGCVIELSYFIDVVDLEEKGERSSAPYLLPSHIRRHMPYMDPISGIADKYGLCLIEDFAQTIDARWGTRHTGTFGKISCFSTQTYKPMNSGEVGLLATDDEDNIAQAILY